MRNAKALLVAVPSFLLGGLLVATLTTTAKAQLALPNTLKEVPLAKDRWEYRAYQPASEATIYTELNKLGDEGWEAYSFGYAGSHANWELKRRK